MKRMKSKELQEIKKSYASREQFKTENQKQEEQNKIMLLQRPTIF